MRLVFVKMHTGYCGMDAHEVFDAEGLTDEEIDFEVDCMAVENASSFGIYRSSEDDEDEELDSEYSGENIEGSWEDYVPEKHDGKRVGGGSFMEQFK